MSQEQEVIVTTTVIERKQADLPRYAVVPASALAAWSLPGTTVVEVSINGAPVERRTIKQWDAERWFISITATDCRRLKVETGDTVTLTLQLSQTALAPELASLLQTEPKAKACWDSLSASQQRALGEEVAAAKQAASRTRRARRALLRE
jgi:hypothetical protein